jgi:ubiquinol-cytochrome c reductase cytochrome b subunit
LRRTYRVIDDQFAIGALVREYMIPVEENVVWYALGGVLAIALLLEILTGAILAMVYVPDAAKAYDITVGMLEDPYMHTILNFHYYTSYVIFGLVMVHMMRVFLSGGYMRGKAGLWLVGVALAGLVFLVSLTGETLHWDERGLAVPWHVAEFFEAIGVAEALHYTVRPDMLDVEGVSAKLVPFYAFHVAIIPILLLGAIAVHYYLVKVKGTSFPFWMKRSGQTASFSRHIRAWVLWSLVILGPVLLLSAFVDRDPGVAPQLLPQSPYYGSEHGPGGLGTTPTFPISWTHGMNRFVVIAFGLEPDIWGTVVGMAIMTFALLVVPFVDRSDHEPATRKEAFDMHKRGWAFVAIGMFWLIMIIGTATNAITPVG